MAVNTHSLIYYGLEVTELNRYIDVTNGTTTKVAKLSLGGYTPNELLTELSLQLNKAYPSEYNFTFDRTTKLFNFKSSVPLTIKFNTGVNSTQSVASLLGFTNASDIVFNSTGINSSISSVKEYRTQFYVQSYLDPKHNKKAVDGQINKSASGKVEVVKFGNERFMECEFKFITDIIQIEGSVVRNTANVQGFIDLMEWLTEKRNIEFMLDESKPNEYKTYMLESTPKDQKGLDYELDEMYDQELALYYKSGVLKFKLME